MATSPVRELADRRRPARLPPPDVPSVQTYDGVGWLTTVPFVNVDTRSRGLPEQAGFDVPELNLRTYVTYEGEPGTTSAASTYGASRPSSRRGCRYANPPNTPSVLRFDSTRTSTTRSSSRTSPGGPSGRSRDGRPRGDLPGGRRGAVRGEPADRERAVRGRQASRPRRHRPAGFGGGRCGGRVRSARRVRTVSHRVPSDDTAAIELSTTHVGLSVAPPRSTRRDGRRCMAGSRHAPNRPGTPVFALRTSACEYETRRVWPPESRGVQRPGSPRRSPREFRAERRGRSRRR